MSGIRTCSLCGNLFKVENAGVEAMRSDGTFPKHACPKCTIPQVTNAAVSEFLDALEALHRCNLRDLAEQPEAALSPAGVRLKRAYIRLRAIPKEQS